MIILKQYMYLLRITLLVNSCIYEPLENPKYLPRILTSQSTHSQRYVAADNSLFFFINHLSELLVYQTSAFVLHVLIRKMHILKKTACTTTAWLKTQGRKHSWLLLSTNSHCEMIKCTHICHYNLQRQTRAGVRFKNLTMTIQEGTGAVEKFV